MKTHKDRPAGTSWILPGGSQVEASTAKSKEEDGQDFFDQFEQQTGGENFNRESSANATSSDTAVDAANKEEEEKEVKDNHDDDDDDDINDFFDEFENATGGENFKR